MVPSLAKRENTGLAVLSTPLFGIFYLLAAGYGFFVSHELTFGLVCLLASAYAFPAPVVRSYLAWSRFLRQRGANSNLVTGLLLGTLAGSLFWTPVYAQTSGGSSSCNVGGGLFAGIGGLMSRVVSGVRNSGGSVNQQNFCNVVSILVNSLRVVFVIYLIVGLIQVINAVRQGEEWKDVARMPLIVFMIGIFGDLLIGFVAGT